MKSPNSNPENEVNFLRSPRLPETFGTIFLRSRDNFVVRIRLVGDREVDFGLLSILSVSVGIQVDPVELMGTGD